MSRQYWSETLAWATANGTAVANTTTETIIFSNYTVGANYMSDGRRLRIQAKGTHGTTGTPTMTFRMRWGGVGGTVLCASGAMVAGSAVSNAFWSMDVTLQTRANGSSGTIVALGVAMLGEDATSTVGSATNAGACDFMSASGVATAPGSTPVTVDLTADTALSITITWGTANASNTLTGVDYCIESMN